MKPVPQKSGHLNAGLLGLLGSSVVKHQEPTLCWLRRGWKLSFSLGPSWNFPVPASFDQLEATERQRATNMSSKFYLMPLVC